MIEVFIAPAILVHADHRRDRGAGGVVKESSNEMADGGFADATRISSRMVHVARAFLLVSEMTFALQQSQHAADCGIGRWVGNIGEDFGGAGASPPVNDLHDLPLSATEVLESALLHQALRAGAEVVCQCIDIMSIA